jgi:membrane protein YqaA with SNARE-associated domain
VHKVVVWIQTVLLPAVGAPGLFVVAFFDSSFLSLPEINDILVVTSSAAHPGQAWLFASMATLGSLAGCLVLYYIGRRGGEPLLVRKFGAERVQRSRDLFHRWDWVALAVPAVLPPPMPFKIFVLAAGVFGFPLRRFALTLVFARGLRYTFWGAIGVVYGERGLGMLKAVDAWFAARGPLLLGLAGVVAAVLLGAWLIRRRRASSALL